MIIDGDERLSPKAAARRIFYNFGAQWESSAGEEEMDNLFDAEQLTDKDRERIRAHLETLTQQMYRRLVK